MVISDQIFFVKRVHKQTNFGCECQSLFDLYDRRFVRNEAFLAYGCMVFVTCVGDVDDKTAPPLSNLKSK